MPPEAATPTRKTVARVTALLVGLALTSLIGFRLAPLGEATADALAVAGIGVRFYAERGATFQKWDLWNE